MPENIVLRNSRLRIGARPGSQDYNSFMLPQITFRMKGTTGLLVAAVIVVALLIWFPGYWLFFAISVGLGVVIALLLFLRNKYFPVSDKDVENKHPLGLE